MVHFQLVTHSQKCQNKFENMINASTIVRGSRVRISMNLYGVMAKLNDKALTFVKNFTNLKPVSSLYNLRQSFYVLLTAEEQK